MTLHTSQLRRQAEERLEKVPYCPRKLVLIHAAVSLGVTLLSVLMSFLFSQMSLGDGGLSGMGQQAVLETVQVTLELAITFLLPFWNIGLIRAVLHWLKGEPATPRTLLEGFRRFGTVFGIKVMTGMAFFAFAMAAINIGSTLFLLTPFSNAYTTALEAILAEAETAMTPEMLMSPEIMARLGNTMIPMLAICLVLFAVVAIPVFYRLRFVEFAAMEGGGAFMSFIESIRITRKCKWQLFKLDLSFWWFYLLQAFTVVLCYGADILGLMGVTLPLSPDLAFFLFYVLGLVGQLVLIWRCQAKISTTYGLAYEALWADKE